MPIYDQSFRRYAGRRRNSFLWWPIARQIALPFLRSKLTYLLSTAVIVPIIVVSVSFFMSAKLKDITKDQADVAGRLVKSSEVPLFRHNIQLSTILFKFLQAEFVFLSLIIVTHGCGIVNMDKRHSALPLYFSRPLTARDYMLGKIVGLGLFPAVALWLAVVIIFVQAWAYFLSPLEALTELRWIMGALVYVLLMSSFAPLAMAAFSSIAKSSFGAGIGFLGFWLASSMAAGIIVKTTGINYASAISPLRSLNVIGQKLLQAESRWIEEDQHYAVFDVRLALLSVLLYALLFGWILRRNLKVVEVVK